MRYCLEPGCPVEISASKRRCPTHQKIWEKDRQRKHPQRKLYTDKGYRKARESFRGLPCSLRLQGCTGYAFTVDHIISLSKGGTNDPSNLRPTCLNCNDSKGGR